MWDTDSKRFQRAGNVTTFIKEKQTIECFILQFLESEFRFRTRVGHDYQCGQIQQNPDNSKLYGVNRRSTLCNSQYFHVADGLPGDAMHDILEGLLQYEAKEMLKAFILEEKYFTIDQLNERIKKFDYDFREFQLLFRNVLYFYTICMQ